MWFLEKARFFFVICHVLFSSLPTEATGSLLSANRVFNKTVNSDHIKVSANNATVHSNMHLRRRLLDTAATDTYEKREPIRILYTVTTLSEYDLGTRATTKGFDRLKDLLIPVVKQGVKSLIARGYHVDVYIVSKYEMTRASLVTSSLTELSPNISVKFWDDAAPISYDPMKRDEPDAKLWENTLGLARQQRFVVKDNLFDYDLFLNFEDDMILNADMVDNYLQMTKTLYKMRETAPDEVSDDQLKNFHGALTKDQLKRCYPGLMRVEVLLDEEHFGTQKKIDPVPVADHPDIDPKPCCHLSDFVSSDSRPQAPGTDQLFLWETNIVALGVRHVDEIGWVTLLRGPRGRGGEKGLTLEDFWSGTQKYFKSDRRPKPGMFEYLNNEGGWMGTRQQIWEWHTEICLGGFLPPFDSPHYNFDGLDPRNVEFWSGGLNLFTARHACNMQRLVSLDPDKFAKHLVYHSANNKQRQLQGKKQSFVKVNDLFGQLLTISKDAEDKMK